MSVRLKKYSYRFAEQVFNGKIQIKNELEAKLFHSYSENETCREQAWQTTVSNLQMLFESVASQSMMGETCEILIEMQTAAS